MRNFTCSMFLSITQIRIVFATWYLRESWIVLQFIYNGTENKFFTRQNAIHFKSLPTRFLSFPVSKRIYFFHHQSKISQRKKILMAVLENKQQRLRFQQLIFIEERTIRLLFCDQCLFWCVKSDKTRNGRGSLPCNSICLIPILQKR